MNADNEGLGRMAGFFSDVEIDRDEYPKQHPSFAEDCAFWGLVILIVTFALTVIWSLYLFPLATLVVSGVIGSALLVLAFFQRRMA